MHFIPVFSASLGMTLRRRALACLLLLFGLTVLGTAQAATYRFGGATVSGCSLSGKAYACPGVTLKWDDRIVIDSGYTVNVQGDVAFGYNNALTMSGTARLTTTGNLNIGDIQPALLSVTGGSFSAGKTFSIGAQAQTIKADISAASMTIGTGSTLQITGTLISAGPVRIASNTTINGAVSGTVITTSTPVKITGNVTATTSFTLASGSWVRGDVDTGRLAIDASDSTIYGSARVDSAVLQWHGKVSKTIICKSGTRAGKCDCVDNQSGWEVNSADGPRCEAAEPADSPFSHFLITHDGSAGTCTAERVTVTACANAACSAPHYNGGASVTLQPGGGTFAIGATGTNTEAEVTSIVKATTKLALTQSGAKPTVQCYNSATGTNSCDMNFTGDVNFSVEVPHHQAGNEVAATIRARKPNDNNTACVPAFKDVSKPVQYSCSRVLPTTGASSCNFPQSGDTRFDATGTATVLLSYPDAGKVALNATLETVAGKGEFIVAPHHFDFVVPEVMRAGADFKVKLVAKNEAGGSTPNFDATALNADPVLGKDATVTTAALDCIGAKLGGQLLPATFTFEKGEATALLNFSEVGRLDLVATLARFLGHDFNISSSTGGVDQGQCVARVGPFLPWAFQVALKDEKRKADNFYYSGEPIPLAIKALNAKGVVTVNYPEGYGSGQNIRFTVVRADGKEFEAKHGTVGKSSAPVAFFKGEAPVDKAASETIPQPSYTYGNALTQPVQIRLRADNGATDPEFLVTSNNPIPVKDAAETEQARPWIRTGRARIGNRFGRTGDQKIDMPVTVEYWTGKSWALNTQDSFTVIPAGAFAQTASPAKPGGTAPEKKTLSNVKIENGKGDLRITGSQPGAIDVAINLGLQPISADQSCLDAHPVSTGAALPWLRSPVACPDRSTTTNPDPSARATFGIFPIENRRVIHVREVFN